MYERRWQHATCTSCNLPYKFRTTDPEGTPVPAYKRCTSCTTLKDAETKFQEACTKYHRAIEGLQKKRLSREDIAKILGRTELHKALLNLGENIRTRKV